MAKLSWNDFISQHPGALGFGTALSGFGRKMFDRNKKVLPTPYALLCKELSTIIKGDWASQRIGKECIFMLADPADLPRVNSRFVIGKGQRPITRSPWSIMHPLGFRDSDYVPLARFHGFAV